MFDFIAGIGAGVSLSCFTAAGIVWRGMRKTRPAPRLAHVAADPFDDLEMEDFDVPQRDTAIPHRVTPVTAESLELVAPPELTFPKWVSHA